MFVARRKLPLKLYFSRYSPRFMEDLVSNEFTNVTLDYAVLFMASPKCAVNPHLRKDIGPLLSACCPFDKRRAQDGSRGASITTSGQVWVRNQDKNHEVDHKIKHFSCERDCFLCLVEVW